MELSDVVEAEYLIETPFPPEDVASVIAGEQSSGTFVRVAGETDELRRRSAASILSVEEVESSSISSLTSAYLQRKGVGGPYRRARIRIAYPISNIGANLPTLAATVSGNLYDLGELTGLKLLDIRVPQHYRANFADPKVGAAGTFQRLGVTDRPLFGTILKPNVGLRTAEIAKLVGQLCEAGVDFIKDDEICADPAWAPLEERIPAVMEVVRNYRQRSGHEVIVAFNITDDIDAMHRHADLIAREEGNCAMVSMNWVGLSALQSLRRSTPLMLHGHRNGFGAWSRHPALGMAFPAYQVLHRLAGVDHMHVHGLQGKFADEDTDVANAARLCSLPVAQDGPAADTVLPVFSSGQWAGTLPATRAALDSSDFLFMAGGGILAHPEGAKAGIESLHQAWETLAAGRSLSDHDPAQTALARALDFFGNRG